MCSFYIVWKWPWHQWDNQLVGVRWTVWSRIAAAGSSPPHHLFKPFNAHLLIRYSLCSLPLPSCLARDLGWLVPQLQAGQEDLLRHSRWKRKRSLTGEQVSWKDTLLAESCWLASAHRPQHPWGNTQNIWLVRFTRAAQQIYLFIYFVSFTLMYRL